MGSDDPVANHLPSLSCGQRPARRPMSIFLIFRNTPLSRQVLHKVEVFWVKKIVEAKSAMVPFLSNCNF